MLFTFFCVCRAVEINKESKRQRWCDHTTVYAVSFVGSCCQDSTYWILMNRQCFSMSNLWLSTWRFILLQGIFCKRINHSQMIKVLGKWRLTANICCVDYKKCSLSNPYNLNKFWLLAIIKFSVLNCDFTLLSFFCFEDE